MHRPDTDRASAQAVNLGYVLNVIEDTAERSETLRSAWRLCGSVMSVAARIVSSVYRRISFLNDRMPPDQSVC